MLIIIPIALLFLSGCMSLNQGPIAIDSSLKEMDNENREFDWVEFSTDGLTVEARYEVGKNEIEAQGCFHNLDERGLEKLEISIQTPFGTRYGGMSLQLEGADVVSLFETSHLNSTFKGYLAINVPPLEMQFSNNDYSYLNNANPPVCNIRMEIKGNRLSGHFQCTDLGSIDRFNRTIPWDDSALPDFTDATGRFECKIR